MIAEFRSTFPNVPVQCACRRFGFLRPNFDGVVAWAFLFAPRRIQLKLAKKIAAILPSGGRLLFTAPSQPCSWLDAVTERPSISLGHDAYRVALHAEGMTPVGTYVDEGQKLPLLALKR
jgi:hypothetical protein